MIPVCRCASAAKVYSVYVLTPNRAFCKLDQSTITCHGPGGIVSVTNAATGSPLLSAQQQLCVWHAFATISWCHGPQTLLYLILALTLNKRDECQFFSNFVSDKLMTSYIDCMGGLLAHHVPNHI